MISVTERPRLDKVPLTKAQASALLCNWLGQNISYKSVRPLEGGICSSVYRLDFESPPYSAVVKLHSIAEDDPLPRECERLEYLNLHTDLPFPQVYCQDFSRKIFPFSFLLMECLPGVNLESAKLPMPVREALERELAEVLLELHTHTAETFHDFGKPPGVREWTKAFLPDLLENRRDMEGLLAKDLLRMLDQVLPLAEGALRNQGEPTLIHNDIWAGNIMVKECEDGWHLSGLLDPAGLQYAEVEKELAYLQAFDTVGEEFFRIYSAGKAIRDGFKYRRMFYWLNTYMTHVWLGFGPEYHDRIAKTCAQIMSIIFLCILTLRVK